MIKLFQKVSVLIIFSILFNQHSFADSPVYIDFKLILNTSDAGKKAQTYLRQKLDKGMKELKKKK